MPMGEAEHRGPGADVRPLREFQENVLRPALVGIPGVAEVATLGGERDEVVVQTTDAELRAAGSRVFGRRDGAAGTAGTRAAADRAQRSPAGPAARQADPRQRPARDVGWRRRRERRLADRGRHRDRETRRRSDRGHRARQAGHRASIARRCPRWRGWACSTTVPSWRGGSSTTLVRAVAEEVAVVALVVLLFLLHGRSALVPMVTLPLVVLLTFAAMRLFGIPATVMSLGGIAIALGMAVDAELVALEACHRRLETDPGGGISGASGWRRRRLVEAAGAFAPAILTSLLIAALAFVPVFAFGGETGRLLRPLALTKTLVILLAAVVTLTVAPALRDRLLRGRIVPELGNPLTRAAGARVSAVRALRAVSPDAHAGDRRRWRRCRACRSFRVWGASSCRASTKAISCTCPPRRPASADDDAPFELADAGPASSPSIPVSTPCTARSAARRPRPIRRRCRWRRRRSGSSPASEWPRVERRRWYSSWAPRPLKRVLRPGLAREPRR